MARKLKPLEERDPIHTVSYLSGTDDIPRLCSRFKGLLLGAFLGLVFWLLIAAAVFGQECTVIDFEEFAPNSIVLQSKGVTFSPHQYRTFPSDCVGDECPCEDPDLSFPGQGNTLIQQEATSDCTPDDEIEGAYMEIVLPFPVDEISGWIGDSEEGTTIYGLLGDEQIWDGYWQMGDNESVVWAKSGVIDRLILECGGSCAIDDLTFCPTPVPTMPSGVLAFAALLSLGGAAWWLERGPR
jgi:hypothetical protein